MQPGEIAGNGHDRLAGVKAVAQYLADFLEHIQINPLDEAVALKDRNEIIREQQALLRVQPADQGLRAENPARFQIDLGLEIGHEFPLVQGLVHCGFHFKVMTAAVLQQAEGVILFGKEHMLVPAVFLAWESARSA